MRLTRHTDYALRVLMYLSAEPDRLASIGEMSAAYGISHNHLMKVVNSLVRAGYLKSVRGRSGGVRLAQLPVTIRVGEVVRMTEDSFRLADCETCRIAPACGLVSVLDEAVMAFLAVLDRYTFADLPEREVDFLSIFLPPSEPVPAD